ncbi:MAG: winged helix-turn-helix domain-containing protein [Sphaerochaeta sp.]|nr:winged helix-turn-helix domain-containing protein [Sphaerochaeta sp.]
MFRIVVPLSDTLELRIIALLKQNPRLKQRELSEQLAISLPTIKRTMMGMVEKNILERKDGKRYGYWDIGAR